MHVLEYGDPKEAVRLLRLNGPLNLAFYNDIERRFTRVTHAVPLARADALRHMFRWNLPVMLKWLAVNQPRANTDGDLGQIIQYVHGLLISKVDLSDTGDQKEGTPLDVWNRYVQPRLGAQRKGDLLAIGRALAPRAPPSTRGAQTRSTLHQ